jgi:hypothetical protein
VPEGLDAGTVWQLAQHAVDSGLGFQTVWDALREGGHPTTREAFESVWKSATELQTARSSIQAGGADYLPTDRDIVDSPVNFRSTYATRVQIEGDILGTTDSGIRYVTLNSDEPMSNGDAITGAVANVLLDPEAYGIQPTGAQVLQVERSAFYAKGGIIGF